MECEICGKPVPENPIKAKIEGSIMVVCKDCAKLGKIQKEKPKPKYQKSNNKNKNKNKQTPQKPYSKKNDEPSEELIENYSKIIREKRESNNWTREQLAEKIFEKVSVINRIESGKMTPDLKITKKLEKTLNITLLEKINNEDLNQYQNNSKEGFTLADVVKIKKK